MSLQAIELSHTPAASHGCIHGNQLGSGCRKCAAIVKEICQQPRLVLSLFPGAGLLDRGFEAAGFCVVRGPDTLLGQRVENFHALPNRFNGVIGGPPCQDFSRARRRPPTGHGLRMLGHFARVVTEAEPDWFLIENVPGVPDVAIAGYRVQRFNLFAWEFGCRQNRNRSFQFGSRDGLPLVILRSTQSQFRRLSPAAMAKDSHRNFAELCELQGLPRDFDLPGLSRTAKARAVGNGVPVPMARSVAEAIRDRAVTPLPRLCACNCGRLVTGRQVTASAACRKRIEAVTARASARPRHIWGAIAMTTEHALAQLSKLPAKEQKALLAQAKLLQLQRAHENRFNLWLEQLRIYLREERGRASELARALGVRRQSAWRWINTPYSKFPAWAAVAAMVWYFRQVPNAATSNELLQLVSPQADKFVRGSPDKFVSELGDK